MDDMLLRKIEELKLYMIEENKINKELLKQMLELKQENEKLKKKVGLK
jgi:hypothetical protein